jgi:CHAT domain-containing protein/tetratricopeptide (TPR) repeat protein
MLKNKNLLYIFVVLIELFSCKNTSPKIAIVDVNAVKILIVKNDSLINLSTDTAKIIDLHLKNLSLQIEIKDWNNWCKTQLELFNLKTDDSIHYASGKEHLDAIIKEENVLQKNDTLKYYLAKAYGNRYYIYDKENLNHKVISDCEKYLQYTNDSLDKDYLTFILNASGVAYSKIGDQQQSILKLERLLAIQKSNNETSEAFTATYVNLSNSYNNIGNNEKAISIASEGLLVANIIKDHQASLQAIIANVAIQKKDFIKATSNINSALRILQNTTEYSRMADLYTINGDLQKELNNYDQAIINFQTSVQYRKKLFAENDNRDFAKTYLKIGDIFFIKKETDSTKKYNNKAIEILCTNAKMQDKFLMPKTSDLYPENALMEAMDAQANLFLHINVLGVESDMKIALEYIAKAFEIETMLRQNYIFDKSKYANAIESKKRSGIGIALCKKLFALTNKQIWLEKAFLFAEKSKANVLLDKVQENILINQNDSTVQKAKKTFLLIEALQKQIKDYENDVTKTTAEIEVLAKDKDELESNYSILKNTINNTLYEKRENLNSDQLFRKTVSILLKKNGAIIEYFVLDSLVYIFTIDKLNGVSLTTLNYSGIKNKINEMLPYLWSANIYNNNPEKYNTIATNLYQQLLPTLITTEKQSAIIIIPDDELFNLPFECLLNLQGEYLIKQYNFMYGFSCSSLIDQDKIKVTYKEKSIAIIAPFVQFEKDNLPMLVQSKSEVEAVEKFYKKAIVIKDSLATKKAFIQNITANATIHIATHSIAAQKDSTQSLIALADTNIYLNEIYGLSINNNLTILSACETGVGQLQKAEGNLSMARAFYYAGSKNVINSLWKVDDKSTGKLFANFYNNLNGKNDIANSLTKAKLTYLKTATKEQQAPYYWSSFICIGTGDIYIKGNDYTVWYIISIVLITTFFFYLYKKRKK